MLTSEQPEATMAVAPPGFTFAVHQVGATRIEITGPTGGVTTIDVPTGYEMRIVQRPWWRRAWSKVRTWAWRMRVAWGSR